MCGTGHDCFRVEGISDSSVSRITKELDEKSVFRPVISILIDIYEDWITGKRYILMEPVMEQ